MRRMESFLWVAGILAGPVLMGWADQPKSGIWVIPADQAVEYRDGDTVCEGFLDFNQGHTGKRPGILVVHEWMGLNDHVKARVKQLVLEGYVALAADIYGKGVRPKDAKEAGALAGQWKADRPAMRKRIQAGLAYLQSRPEVDPNRIAVIGYCFGGTVALELARSGAEVKGVVSFHGGLSTPTPEDAGKIKGKVLVLHGGDDPFVPAKEIEAFQEEMKKAEVDWQMVVYGGAVHSFTNPTAGRDPTRGAAYHEKADKRSWEAMKVFFKEIFR